MIDICEHVLDNECMHTEDISVPQDPHGAEAQSQSPPIRFLQKITHTWRRLLGTKEDAINDAPQPFIVTKNTSNKCIKRATGMVSHIVLAALGRYLPLEDLRLNGGTDTACTPGLRYEDVEKYLSSR